TRTLHQDGLRAKREPAAPSLAPGLRLLSSPGMEVAAMLVFENALAFGTVPRRSRSRFAFVIAGAVFVTALVRPAVIAAPPSAPSAPPARHRDFASREEAIATREALRAWMASRPRPGRRRVQEPVGTPAFVDVARPVLLNAPGIEARTAAALMTDPDH